MDHERGSGQYLVQSRRRSAYGWLEVGQVINGADYPQSNLHALVGLNEVVRIVDSAPVASQKIPVALIKPAGQLAKRKPGRKRGTWKTLAQTARQALPGEGEPPPDENATTGRS